MGGTGGGPPARYWTWTMPCIIASWTSQKYGNVPDWVNVWRKVMPVPTPESQMPSALQVAPGHVPDVVEWDPETQTHSIVSPTAIVDVLVPLCWSVNELPPPAPTWTVRTVPPVGVGVGVA